MDRGVAADSCPSESSWRKRLAMMTSPTAEGTPSTFGVDMYWLPLGARGRWLRFGGKVYEALAALLGGREQLDIFHAVLELHTPRGAFVIEMGPAIDDDWS